MTDWAKLKVVDLKAELKRRGLPQHGLKGELVARLEAADNQVAQPEEEDQHQSDSAQPDTAGEESADVAPGPAAVQPESPAAQHGQPEEQPVTGQEHEPAPTEEDRNVTPMSVEATSATPDDDKNPSTQPDDDHGGKMQAGELAADDSIPEPDNEPTKMAISIDVPSDSPLDSQKRKRRSASPPPSDETVARKRARAEITTNGEDVPAVDNVDKADLAAASPPTVAQERVDEKESPAQKQNPSDPPTTQTTAVVDSKGCLENTEQERDVAPAVHPATSALYISNLMRPLRPIDIREHLAKLASTSSSDSSDDLIVKFHLDQIRTHAFVIFNSTSSATRVRAELHNCVWPNESNRKALFVDFIPSEKVGDWVEMEESSGSGRSGSRWEVIYRDGPDGSVEAHLESSATPNFKSGPLPNTRPTPKLGNNSANAIPLGPRGHRDMGPPPPTGPRASRPAAGPGPRPPSNLDHVVERTHSRPVITYQLISEDLARRRIDNMRSFYSRDTRRDLGREINRYSFEDGDKFVDRGKEVFEGIRPPHRERAIERERRGGGGSGSGRSGGHGARSGRRGGPPFRPRSDRYLPGRSSGNASGRDDRSSRHGDDRSSSRHGNDRDRDRDYRDRRH